MFPIFGRGGILHSSEKIVLNFRQFRHHWWTVQAKALLQTKDFIYILEVCPCVEDVAMIPGFNRYWDVVEKNKHVFVVDYVFLQPIIVGFGGSQYLNPARC